MISVAKLIPYCVVFTSRQCSKMLAEMITDSDSEEVARVGRDHSSLGIENQGQRLRLNSAKMVTWPV